MAESKVIIGTAGLAGADSTAIVQVIATDGVHTGMGLSRTFSVPKKVPAVFIVSPENGRHINEGEVLIIAGRAYDFEDGPLTDRSLVWLLDGVVVGNGGRWLFLAQLPVGKHTVSLRVTDGDGNRTSDSMEVNVDELSSP